MACIHGEVVVEGIKSYYYGHMTTVCGYRSAMSYTCNALIILRNIPDHNNKH